MSRPRVIVNARPQDYVYVGRVVALVTDPSYEWPADGITCFGVNLIGGSTVDFGIRRNKASITIYGPDAEAQA